MAETTEETESPAKDPDYQREDYCDGPSCFFCTGPETD